MDGTQKSEFFTVFSGDSMQVVQNSETLSKTIFDVDSSSNIVRWCHLQVRLQLEVVSWSRYCYKHKSEQNIYEEIRILGKELQVHSKYWLIFQHFTLQ